MDSPRTYFDLFTDSPERVKYPAGSVIFDVGTPGKEMYVVVAGIVEMRAGLRLLETLQKGDIFGELALVDKDARSATAIALTDCELVPIDEKQFEYLLQRRPFFGLEVMRVMAQRLRRNLTQMGPA